VSFDPFFDAIVSNRLQRFQDQFRDLLTAHYQPQNHGDFASWADTFSRLPSCNKQPVFKCDRDVITIGTSRDLCKQQHDALNGALRGLMPWRKGPFNFFGHFIDTEWRSDFKWQRLQSSIASLQGRYVLDIGCGNGYHCWRMFGAGARFVVGVDQSPKFIFQFNAVKKYAPETPVFYLPLRSENLPADMQCFDTVFSMGVLYHCKSPFTHLEELKAALRPGGELILETLVIAGDENTVLCPVKRYASMPNVWLIGSAKATRRWLQRAGFENITIIDETVTTPEEQRKTNWMTFNSLADFLDPSDSLKTVEGYPAPTRAILKATKKAQGRPAPFKELISTHQARYQKS